MWNTRFLRLFPAAVFITSLLLVPAAGQAAGAGDRSSTAALAKIGIDNFGRIDSTYFRGAQPKGRDYDDLTAAGIKTLINLTSDDVDPGEKAMAARVGLKYFEIPMTTHRPPTEAQLAEFLRIVNDPANQPVYVHCVGGRHRTGVMTAAYRMTHDHWNAEQAFTEMKRYKFGADFLHPEFKEFVYGYRNAVKAVATPAAAVATKVGG